MKHSIGEKVAAFIFRGGNIIHDETLLYRELASCGYEQEDILEAIDWFTDVFLTGDLHGVCDFFSDSEGHIRIQSAEEEVEIPNEFFNHLLALKKSGYIDRYSFEDIVNKLMVHQGQELDKEDLQSLLMLQLVENYRVDWQTKVVELQKGRTYTN